MNFPRKIEERRHDQRLVKDNHYAAVLCYAVMLKNVVRRAAHALVPQTTNNLRKTNVQYTTVLSRLSNDRNETE